MKTVFLAALVLGTTLGGPSLAQDEELGGEFFFTYCASCHGDDATGGGPMASILNVTPPDLTGLAAANGGAFPVTRVVYRIDGRDPVLAHGGPMPIFGDIFEGEVAALKSESGQPILTGKGIADLVAWLETVQR
jgi:mono/diheme cytochrome c family protein